MKKIEKMKKYASLPPFVTRVQAAQLLDVSVRSIAKYISSGMLKSVKVGGNRRISTKSLIDTYDLDADTVLQYLNTIDA